MSAIGKHGLEPRRRSIGQPARNPALRLRCSLAAPRPVGWLEVIPHAARSRLCRIIVVYCPDTLPGVSFSLLRELNVANLMVEDDYLLRAGSFFQQNPYFRVVDFLHFCAIVKVAHRGFLANELKSLPVK